MRVLMNLDLEKLIRLQRAENDLRGVETRLSEIPRLKTALDAGLEEERRRLSLAKDALALCQKARRQHEGELQDLEARRSRYKDQLMEVKTNKEYTAMLHEIEVVERDIRAREDQILSEMEKAETLASEAKREEGIVKGAEQKHLAESRLLDERSGSLEAELRRLTAERDDIAATVPESFLDLFRRVARLRGVAVAEARDAMCQLCHLKLRLQMFMDIKRNEEIMQCPACNRILFYEPPPQSASPEP